jgi:AraC-like DNA-binding protein
LKNISTSEHELLSQQRLFVEAFNSLPDVLFYIKDIHCRWVTCNDASIRFLNFRSRQEVYGAVEYDFFPKKIADVIRADDESVLKGGQKIVNRTELIVDDRGRLAWVSTNKMPIRSQSGDVIGLVGTTRLMRKMDELPAEYIPFHRAIDHIQENIEKTIYVSDLARISNLSVSQFRKRFVRLFRLPPQEFIIRSRLQMAAKMLSTSDISLAQTALKCGFCDQSYFTKQFLGFFDMTPGRYRKIWQSPTID